MTFVLLISKVLQRLTCWSAGSDGSSQRMCTQLNTWLCVPCTAALQLSCDQWTQPPPSNDTFSRRSIFGGTQSVSRWMVFSLQSERQCMPGPPFSFFPIALLPLQRSHFRCIFRWSSLPSPPPLLLSNAPCFTVSEHITSLFRLCQLPFIFFRMV